MQKILITHNTAKKAENLATLLIKTLKVFDIPYTSSLSFPERGGQNTIHLIVGAECDNPHFARNEADVIISGDPMASLHSIDFLKPHGYLVTEEEGSLPARARKLGYSYPKKEEFFEEVAKHDKKVYSIPAKQLCEDRESQDLADTILLAKAIGLGILPVPWISTSEHIEDDIPKTAGMDVDAFHKGYAYQ